jgi:hypothetical protein
MGQGNEFNKSSLSVSCFCAVLRRASDYTKTAKQQKMKTETQGKRAV